jgi:hypothetical protein
MRNAESWILSEMPLIQKESAMLWMGHGWARLGGIVLFSSGCLKAPKLKENSTNSIIIRMP